jgi:hypothetical protein
MATVLLAFLAACGGAPLPTISPSAAPTPTATRSVSDAVIAAADATIAQGTVRIDQTLDINGSTVIPNGTSASASGQASFGIPRQMVLSGDFTDFGVGEVDMIIDDSLIYMTGPVFEEMAGEGKWLLVDLESDDPRVAPFKSLATGQNDVGIAIVYLYGMTGAVTERKGVELDGVPMTLYEGTSDLEAARDNIPEQFSEAFEIAVASLLVAGIQREIDTQVWVGDDGLVHRVRYVYALGPTQGGGSMETVMDFSDFGASMDLGIPSDDVIVPIEEALPSASPAPTT